MFGVVVD